MLSLREHAELLTPRPANSSQQPTKCRSLARRFRASFCATLRVALPESEGTWRLSERTLARPKMPDSPRCELAPYRVEPWDPKPRGYFHGVPTTCAMLANRRH